METTQLDRIEAMLNRLLSAKAPGSAAAASHPGAVADDADLDSQYGDELLKYHLKEKWWPNAEPSFAGKKMSQCPADYLDAVANSNEKRSYAMNASGDPEEAKKATYRTRTAKRARGWADRVRAGKVTQVDGSGHDIESDEIPF